MTVRFTNGIAANGTSTVAQSGSVEFYSTADQVTNYAKATMSNTGNFIVQTSKGGTGVAGAIQIISPAITATYNTSSTATVGALGLTPAGGNTLTGVSVTGTYSSATATQNAVLISPTINQLSTGTASYTALLINVTETSTATAGTKRLIDAQVGSTSKFSVSNTGVVTATSIAATTLTSPTISGYTETVTTATVGSTYTISITTSTMFVLTLTANTTTTFTMPTATAGQSFTVQLRQPAATGGGAAIFTNVRWPGTAPTITTAAGKMDILNFVADGTNWYGSTVQGYTY